MGIAKSRDVYWTVISHRLSINVSTVLVALSVSEVLRGHGLELRL